MDARGYAVRFPFRVKREGGVQPRLGADTVAGLKCRMEVGDRQAGEYVLSLQGFESEAEAKAAAERVRATLSLAQIEMGIPFEPNRLAASAEYAEDPAALAEDLKRRGFAVVGSTVDGIADGGRPCYFPEGKALFFAGEATVKGIAAPRREDIGPYLREAIEGRADGELSGRLATALELYRASLATADDRARLTALFGTLEALGQRKKKGGPATLFHGELQKFLEQRARALPPETAKEAEEAAAAIGELTLQSVGQAIRETIGNSLRDRPTAERKEVLDVFRKIAFVRTRHSRGEPVSRSQQNWAVAELLKLTERTLASAIRDWLTGAQA